jgi:hypothetical protein
MLSFCTSPCRWTNACEPQVQHCYTSRADARHSKSGPTSPLPAVAHWRGSAGSGTWMRFVDRWHQARLADVSVRLARGPDIASVSGGLG